MMKASEIPIEIWVLIAEHLEGEYIKELSKALWPYVKAPELYSNLEWIKERTEGVYKYGTAFITKLLRANEHLWFIRSTLRILSDSQRQHLVRNMAVEATSSGFEWSFIHVLINHCYMPVEWLIVCLKVHKMQGNEEEFRVLLKIAGCRMNKKLVAQIYAFLPDDSYLAVMEKFTLWLNEKSTYLKDSGQLTKRLMKSLRKSASKGWFKRRNSVKLWELEAVLELALENGDMELTQFIMDSGVFPSSRSLRFRLSGAMIQLLLNYGVNPVFVMFSAPVEQLQPYGLQNMYSIMLAMCRRLDFEAALCLIANDGLSMIMLDNLLCVLKLLARTACATFAIASDQLEMRNLVMHSIHKELAIRMTRI